MGRLGYALLLTLIAGLIVYVSWPEGERQDAITLLPATFAEPASFTVKSGGLEQAVSDGKVRLHGLERPLDPFKTDRLWGLLRQVSVDKRDLVEGVPEALLGSYGLDGKREVVTPTLRLRWSVLGQHGYLWDGNSLRLFSVPAAVPKHLDDITARLDREGLVDAARLARIEIAAVVQPVALVFDGRAWRDELRIGRPPFDRRVEHLRALLAGLQLIDFDARAPAAAPDLGSVRVEHQGAVPGLGQAVRLWNAGEAALVQVDDLPVQKLAAPAARLWRELLGEFQNDYLVDLFGRFADSPLTEVLVTRAGADVFRLEKHGLRDLEQGLSQWDVVWPGGREIADGDAAAALALAFDRLAVRDVQPRGAAAPPPDATVVDFVFQLDEHHEPLALIAVAGGFEVWSPAYRGTVAKLPEALADLSPERMLDPTPIGRDAGRVAKLQRIFHENGETRAEVFALDGGGTWHQSYPAAAKDQLVDGGAVERVARAACSARARAARFITAADRAVLAAPEFELDLRFAPVAVRHSTDTARLDDTTDQDVGLACSREGSGWRMVDKEGALSFLVDDDLIDLLRLPLADRLVLPLLPALVRRIEVKQAGGGYVLSADAGGATWTAQALDASGKPGDSQPADTTEVRRYLRRLATLRAARVDAKAAPLQGGEVAATVICDLPKGEATERQTLTIATHAGADVDWVLSAESNAATRHAPVGRCFLPAAEAATVAALTPPLSSLLSRDPGTAPAGR